MNYQENHKTKKFYQAWLNMKQRCFNKNCNNYNNYGARGITVYRPWLIFLNFFEDNFETYWESVQLYGFKETTLDRIDNNKGYFPENVTWSSYKQQANNRRKCLKTIEYNGNIYNLNDLSKISGIKYATLRHRIKSGKTGNDITKPIDKKYMRDHNK